MPSGRLSTGGVEVISLEVLGSWGLEVLRHWEVRGEKWVIGGGHRAVKEGASLLKEEPAEAPAASVLEDQPEARRLIHPQGGRLGLEGSWQRKGRKPAGGPAANPYSPLTVST